MRCAVAIALLVAISGVCRGQPQTLPPAAPPVAQVVDPPKAVDGKVDDEFERIEADTSKKLLREFRAQNPNAREHKLARTSMGYEEDSENPALRLDNVWVGSKSTLFEITGLPRQGKVNSAVLRRDTLRVSYGKGMETELISSEGTTELRDRKGGSALIVNPGDKVYLLFDSIDDSRPFTLFHVNRDGNRTIYFEDVDPRFRERYDAAFAKTTTPDGMKEFLVEFARNDPDKRAPKVFVKLISEMRAQKSFEGYYTAYLLIEETADAKQAQRLATTEEHKRKLEHIAITALADKSRLLDFDVRLNAGSTSSGEGRCIWLCRYNFSGTRAVSGTLTVKARLTGGSPIRLRHGRYKVIFSSRMTTPVHFERRSSWLGNASKDDEAVNNHTFTVTLSPPDYEASIPISFGTVNVAWFERGSQGGWEARWATGDPQISMSFRSMDLLP